MVIRAPPYMTSAAPSSRRAMLQIAPPCRDQGLPAATWHMSQTSYTTFGTEQAMSLDILAADLATGPGKLSDHKESSPWVGSGDILFHRAQH